MISFKLFFESMNGGYNIPPEMKDHPKFQETWASNSVLEKVFKIFKRYGEFKRVVTDPFESALENSEYTSEEISDFNDQQAHNTHFEAFMEFEDELWHLTPEKMFLNDKGNTNNWLIYFFKNKDEDDDFEVLSPLEFLKQMNKLGVN